jgi:hypothetical protein
MFDGVAHLEQALLTLPKHLSSPLVFSGIRVAPFARASVFCFVHHYLSFCPFSFAHCIVYPSFAHCIVYPSFAHCIVYPSSIYEFLLPLWYL